MSQLRRFEPASLTSGLPLSTDIDASTRLVRCTPKPDSRDHGHASRVAYCCDLLSSSRSRTSSDTKRSARCHASSLSPRNWKYFRNTTRWDVLPMATVCFRNSKRRCLDPSLALAGRSQREPYGFIGKLGIQLPNHPIVTDGHKRHTVAG
jgi:hypothetical protein